MFPRLRKRLNIQSEAIISMTLEVLKMHSIGNFQSQNFKSHNANGAV